jgi:hypothetical protein
MPAWLPFAIAASLLIALGSGSRAGWQTQADQAAAEAERRRRAANPPLVQGTAPRALPPPPPPGVPPRPEIASASRKTVKQGNWHKPDLPFRVVFQGRLFQKDAPSPMPPSILALYHEVHGKGVLTVHANGRFAVV